jgi:hypothetical protein
MSRSAVASSASPQKEWLLIQETISVLKRLLVPAAVRGRCAVSKTLADGPEPGNPRLFKRVFRKPYVLMFRLAMRWIMATTIMVSLTEVRYS